MEGDSVSNPRLIRVCINGRDYDVTPQYMERQRQRRRRRRREEDQSGLRRSWIPSSSSSRRTDHGQRSEHATPTRVRQSSMYSDCPRRSGGNRAQLPSNLPAVEVATEGSSNWLGPTTADAANLETLSQSDSRPTLDRTDGSHWRSEHAIQTRIRQSSMYLDRRRRSRGNRGAQPPTNLTTVEVTAEDRSNELGPTIVSAPYLETLSLSDSPPTLDPTDGSRDVVHAVDTSRNLTDSTIMEPLPVEEALSPRLEKLWELEDYLYTPTFDNIDDAFEYLCNSHRGFLAARVQQSSLDKCESGSELILEQKTISIPAPEQALARSITAPEQALARSITAPEQALARSIPAPEQALARSIPAPEPLGEVKFPEASTEEIAENGKEWMREEVMLAFKEYIEDKDDFKDILYEFDELQLQCFNVENYYKIFHHFNFTVKTKTHGSADWTSMLFFAEVKEILRQKIYFCSPLELDENGHCYACKMQGMDDLRHPIIGVYDRGSPDTAFPSMYGFDEHGFMYD